jgi:YVTN family beta-propeller protein
VAQLRLSVLLLLLVSPAARAADSSAHVYLQPLPSEAARLTFTIASVSAIAVSGEPIPLKVALTAIRMEDAGRQRLLANGRLPVGGYAGFSIGIRRAAVKNGREEAALAVPETPVRVDFPFVITARQASVAWLALKYEGSVTAGFGFSPLFTAVTPPRPIADHAGFVTNTGSNTLTVFDKSLAQVVAVIDTCAGPAGMALDQRRRRVYVACSKDDEIQSIDVATGDVLERTRVSPGDRPRELALTPDGMTLLSVNAGSNSVTFFDAVSLARRERVNVGSGPGSVVIDPDGRRAFISNTLSSSLSVIDVANHSLLATLSTEASPLRAVFNRRADRLYVIHDRSPYMTVLDPRQLTTGTRARLRIGVSAIAVDTVRDLVCIGGDGDPTIEFYDPNALMPVYSMKSRSGASFLAFDAEDNRLYMVSPQTRSVAVAGLADRKVVAEFDAGDGPFFVVVMGQK